MRKINNRENIMEIIELSMKLLYSDTDENTMDSVLGGAISVLKSYDEDKTECIVVYHDLWFSLLGNKRDIQMIKDLNGQIKSLTKKLETRTNRVSILKEEVRNLKANS